MEFLCKKDCYLMEIPGMPRTRIFTAGKGYTVVPGRKYHAELGHCVINDQGEPNWIGKPNKGHRFFDEYFENQEIEGIKKKHFAIESKPNWRNIKCYNHLIK